MGRGKQGPPPLPQEHECQRGKTTKSELDKTISAKSAVCCWKSTHNWLRPLSMERQVSFDSDADDIHGFRSPILMLCHVAGKCIAITVSDNLTPWHLTLTVLIIQLADSWGIVWVCWGVLREHTVQKVTCVDFLLTWIRWGKKRNWGGKNETYAIGRKFNFALKWNIGFQATQSDHPCQGLSGDFRKKIYHAL